MNRSSVFDLWVEYPLSKNGIRVRTSGDPASLESLANQLLREGCITNWYIIEKRAEVTLHVHKVMGD